MSVSNNLREAIQTRNIANIRSCLWACLSVDMNMTGVFKESIHYVLSHGIDADELFEIDDEKPFESSPSMSNFSTLGGMLMVNFSRKKLDALKIMGMSLYPPAPEIEHPSIDSIKGNAVREVPPTRGRGDAGRKPGINATTIAAIAATVILIAIGGGYLLYKIIK